MKKTGKKVRHISLILAIGALLVFAPVVYFSLTHAPKTYAEWFNTSWGYRGAIRFGNTGAAVTNQKVLIAYNTLNPIAGNKMQSSCQDVRFTDSTGAVLKYYVNPSGGAGVGCNDTSTDFYVLMPSIVTGSNLIYIYYGNPAATAGTVAANFTEPTFSPTSGPTNDAEEKAPGPVALWHFDEGQGSTANDATGHGNSLTLTNTAWATQSASLSNRTQYLQFNGATSVASRTNDTDFDFGTGSFTVSAWFRHAATISNTDVLITKYNTAGWKVYMNSSGYMCFGIDDDSTWGPDDSACSAAGSGSFADSKWHHVEAVKSGTTSITVYVDGKQVAQTTSLTATGSLSTTQTLYVGADSAGNTNWWDGWIDDVAIYPYARTANQVKLDIFDSSDSSRSAVLAGAKIKDSLTDGLVLDMRMNEATWSGVTGEVKDDSGNRYNGTAVGGTGGKPYTAAGKFGNGGFFDRVDDYVAANGVVPSISGINHTITFWEKTTTCTGTQVMVAANTSSAGNKYQIYISGSSCKLGIFTQTEGAQLSTSATPGNGSWHHIAVVINDTADTATTYIDGVADQVNIPFTATVVSSDLFSIGQEFDSGTIASDFWGGTMDNLKVYNRILSAAEIRELYAFAPGPVAYWNFDQNTGQSAYDISGNGNALTLGSTTSPEGDDPGWMQGKVGSALRYDGVDDVAFVTDPGTSALDITGALTISAWIYKTAATASNGWADMVVKANAGATDANYWFQIHEDTGAEYLDFFFTNGTGSFEVRGTQPLSLNRWQYVTLVYDDVANTIQFYVDGVPQTGSNVDVFGSGANLESLRTNDQELHVGYTYSGQMFPGFIDEVKIYNYARTTAQILQDRNSSAAGGWSPAGTIAALWNFDEGSGTTAYDSGPNALNLTLSSVSWTNDGKFDKAWRGNGTKWMSITDAASADKLDFAAADDFSVSMWFRTLSASNPSGAEFLLSKAESSAGYRIFAENDGSGVIKFGVDDDATWTPGDFVSTVSDVYDTKWHHIVAVKQGQTKLQMYLDGVLKNEDTSISETGTLANSITMYLGDRNGVDGGDEFNGDLDTVKIYRTALSQDQVLMEYNQGKSLVLGNLSTDISGNASNSAERSYCPPGDTDGGCASTGSPSPLTHWKLDENTGTSVSDIGTKKYTGTTANTVWRQGKFGPSLYFNGSTSQVSFGDSKTIEGSSEASVCAWIKYEPSTVTTDGAIVSRYSGSNPGWLLWVNDVADIVPTYDTISFAVVPGPTLDGRVDGPTGLVRSGVWDYYCGVFKGSTYIRLYQNGILVAENTTSTPATVDNTDTATTYIGRIDNAAPRWFQGQIDDVRIYNYARTQSQIAWDYNKGAPMAWWKLDECQGSTVYDSALTANDAAGGKNGTISAGASGNTSAGSCGSGTSTEMWNDGTMGRFGAGLGFDGTDDSVEVASPSLPTTDFTYSMWVNHFAASTDTIFTVSDSAGTADEAQIKMTNTGTFRFVLDGASKLTTTETYALNTWHHVVMNRKGSNMTMYVDGRNVGTGTDADTLNFGTCGLIFGYDSDGAGASCTDTPVEYWEGIIDDFRVYNYALSAQQVKMLYNGGAAVRFGQ